MCAHQQRNNTHYTRTYRYTCTVCLQAVCRASRCSYRFQPRTAAAVRPKLDVARRARDKAKVAWSRGGVVVSETSLGLVRRMRSHNYVRRDGLLFLVSRRNNESTGERDCAAQDVLGNTRRKSCSGGITVPQLISAR